MFFRLLLLFVVLCCFQHPTNIETEHQDIVEAPIEEVVVEEKIINIFIDDLESAKTVAQKYNRSIILIFTADWCKYCETLKAKYNTFFIDQNKSIVCYVNTDHNPALTKEYGISVLPTSVLLIPTNNGLSEKTRISGFNNEKYKIWLQNN